MAEGVCMAEAEVTVRYHHEDDAWWADSEQVGGFTAVAESLDELRDLVKEGLPFYLGVTASELSLLEERDGGLPVYSVKVVTSEQQGTGSLPAPLRRPEATLSSRAPSTTQFRPRVTKGVVRCH